MPERDYGRYRPESFAWKVRLTRTSSLRRGLGYASARERAPDVKPLAWNSGIR